MFNKIIILLILGTYVISEKINIIQKNTIDQWEKDIQETIQEYYNQSKKVFENTTNELKRRISNLAEIGKEKFSELKERYNKIQLTSNSTRKDNINWEFRLQELKEFTTEAVNNINEKYERLKRKTQHVIQKQQEKWQKKFKELLVINENKLNEIKS